MPEVAQTPMQLAFDFYATSPILVGITPPKKLGRPPGCKDSEPRNRRGQGKRPKKSPNHAALTEAFIDRIKPPLRSRVIWDTRQPGFGARINPSKPGDPQRAVYVIGYQDARGHRVIDSIGAFDAMGLPEARKLARLMEQKVSRGISGKSTHYRGAPFLSDDAIEKLAPENLSLKPADAIDRHLDWLKENQARNTWLNRQTTFNYHIRAWAEKFESVRAITQDDVFDLFRSKPPELSSAVLNNIYSAIKTWFKCMRKVERIIDHNVTAGIGQPRKPSERTRWLTDDEIRWLWQACTAEGYPWGDNYKLQLLLAQRVAEVREMPLSELQFRDGQCEWEIPKERTKSGREHIVPVSGFALELIESILGRGNEKYLFTKDDQTPMFKSNEARVRVARLMEAYRAQELLKQGKNPHLGSIPPWDLRDLRRTAATIMARHKHPLHVVDKILNHGGARTGTGRTVGGMVTRIYVKHEFIDERREVLRDFGEYIRRLVQAS